MRPVHPTVVDVDARCAASREAVVGHTVVLSAADKDAQIDVGELVVAHRVGRLRTHSIRGWRREAASAAKAMGSG